MPEQQNIEWKARWNDEYLKWICGFANAQGGKIFIGCDDTGHVVGVNHPKKLLEDIPNKVQAAMGILVDVNLHEKDGLSYLEIAVPSYPMGISCKGMYYYRSGSTMQVLTGLALEAFLMRSRGVTWDSLPLPVFRLEDVDAAAIAAFRKRAERKGRIDSELLDESEEVLLQKLHLVNNGQLTHAAMLLFSSDPERWQLGAYLKIGFFKSDDELVYQDEIHGPLLEQVDRAVSLIYLKYLKARITYQGMQRMERYFVPEAALREALLNAICHKQYQSGVPVQISVYEDRLYVANAGDLPQGWTLEHLMRKHASKPYNPNIANAFYLAGFIESWGRGIEKICAACLQEGLPRPEYTIHPGDIMIRFSAWPDGVTDGVTDQEKSVLLLIAEDPGYTMQQMAEKLHVSRKTVANYLRRLKESHRIQRVGSPRNGHWELCVRAKTKENKGD